MQETIQSRLASSRKELLDLGLRNPLLNYKLTKGKGLHIVDEKADAVYDILVRQQKAMTFLALKEDSYFPKVKANTSIPACKRRRTNKSCKVAY
jgi:hypothetical protein